VRRTDNLTIYICRLSYNLGASTSWKPQGLSRPVTGLLLQSDFKEFRSRLWDSAMCCVSLYDYRSQDYVTLMTVVKIDPNFATR
jgi:hypothetical protein